MKWYEITVFTTDEGTDEVCSVLEDAGLEGFTIEESRETAAAVLEQSVPFWDFADMENIGTEHPCVRTYLEKKRSSLAVIEKAKAAVEDLKKKDAGGRLGPLELTVSERDDEDWANNWKQYYKPIEIGSRLLVLPSWEDEPETERTVLRLDPGMAFGSGSHQTTKMCLSFLDETVRKGDRVLDLGCGSGILSIAAILLGADSAVAVDVDPAVEHVARSNADLNGIPEGQYSILVGNVVADSVLRNRLGGPYDIVVANIVADVIIGLAPYAIDFCREGSVFIVSGIIDERMEEVRNALRSGGFIIRREEKMDDWNAICTFAP